MMKPATTFGSLAEANAGEEDDEWGSLKPEGSKTMMHFDEEMKRNSDKKEDEDEEWNDFKTPMNSNKLASYRKDSNLEWN